MKGNDRCMPRNSGFTRYYLKFHYWLRRRCDQLNPKQRKWIVYGLSFVYLVCSLTMIVQFFLPGNEEQALPIPTGDLVDSPMMPNQSLDSLGFLLKNSTQQILSENEY